MGRLVIVDRALRAGQDDTVGLELFGEEYIGKCSGSALIIEEGEAFEEEALEMTLTGRMNYITLEIMPGQRPTI
ncbi:hypothetical protein JOE09_000075 [Pantoea coffeiphila]|nr:hypothetical protein [Pantoea coffeiphila]